MAKVKSAEFTTKKIAGLDVRMRESYLSLLETNLRKNYDGHRESATSGEAGLCEVTATNSRERLAAIP